MLQQKTSINLVLVRFLQIGRNLSSCLPSRLRPSRKISFSAHFETISGEIVFIVDILRNSKARKKNKTRNKNSLFKNNMLTEKSQKIKHHSYKNNLL